MNNHNAYPGGGRAATPMEAEALMEKKSLKTINLDNGLDLKVFDASRKIAGDRWFISVIAEIDIPVNGKTVDEKALNASVDQVKNLLGDTVIFKQRIERNFIAANEKEKRVEGLVESFLTRVTRYFSHEQFAAKYIAKCYREAVGRQKWYQRQ